MSWRQSPVEVIRAIAKHTKEIKYRCIGNRVSLLSSGQALIDFCISQLVVVALVSSELQSSDLCVRTGVEAEAIRRHAALIIHATSPSSLFSANFCATSQNAAAINIRCYFSNGRCQGLLSAPPSVQVIKFLRQSDLSFNGVASSFLPPQLRPCRRMYVCSAMYVRVSSTATDAWRNAR